MFLGVVEDTARFLEEVLAAAAADPSEADLRTAAERAVAERVAAGQRIPGLGHPIHKVQDPRTPRIYEIAEETGQLGPHLRLLRIVARRPPRADGRRAADQRRRRRRRRARRPRLPGRAPARLRAARADRRPARHLAEEMEQPMGMPLYREVDERVTYEPGT